MKYKNSKPKQSKNAVSTGDNEQFFIVLSFISITLILREVADTHYEDMLKGVEKKFSVFNRRQQREEKKKNKKQKKQEFFGTSKEMKKDKMIEKLRIQEREEQIKLEKQRKSQDQKTNGDEIKKQKDEARKIKLEKEELERKKKQEAEKIQMDNEEIDYFENLLGKRKSKQGEKKFKKEMELEGWGDDFLSFLDNISTVVKTDVKEYKPFFQEEGIIQEEEIDELLEGANSKITLAGKKGTKNSKQQIIGNNEDESNQNQDQDDMSQEIQSNDEEEEQDEENNDEEEEEEEENDVDEEGEEEEEDQDDENEEEDEEEEDDNLDIENENNSMEEEEDENEDEEDEDEDDEEEDDDEESYELVEEKEENQNKSVQSGIKSILKGKKVDGLTEKTNSSNKNKLNTQQGQGQELTEMQKWLLEKQQKKEVGQTDDEKERQRIMAELEKKDFEKRNAIRKILINAFNRLSETNIDIIFKEILLIFEANPKNLINPVLSDLFTKTTIEPIKVAQYIMASNSVVISGIHQIYDNECFGPIMKQLLLQYQSIIANPKAIQDDDELGEDTLEEDFEFQRLRNITMIFSYFYLFDDISIDFISGYLQHLLTIVSSRTLDALLILVQHVGSKIRQDNPAILKQIIDQTKSAVDEYTNKRKAKGMAVPKKIEFIMMTLNDIRMNKKQKTDPAQRLSFFITWLKKNVLQKMKVTNKVFPVDFKTAFHANKDTPRWYSQFETGAFRHDTTQNDDVTDATFGEEFNHLNEKTRMKLEELARQCRMTTDTKKRIFMMIMSSEDYIEAAQRVLKLKINKKQTSEIAVVIVQCCAQEKNFNQFYVHLTQKLIEVNPKGKFSFQYALWDQFKLLEGADLRKINNLAKYLALLCASKSLGITALKFFELDSPSEHTIIFLKIFLPVFFDKISSDDLNVQLTKATAREENYVFVEALKDFLRNYFWKFVISSNQHKQNEQLKEAVKFSVKKLKMQVSKKKEAEDD